MQRIFVTGGSGDLGQLLITDLRTRKIEWVNYDLSPHPQYPENDVKGDICDASCLTKSMKGCTTVVHIAALHGVHEMEGVSEDMFVKVNVEGTRNVLLAMKENGIDKLVFLSSESVNKRNSIYGKSKIACETMIDELCKVINIKVVSLRCRSFIPPTNKSIYSSFDEWFEYFSRGGVHVKDVAQAVICAMDYCYRKSRTSNDSTHIRVVVDGKYEVNKDVTDEEWAAYIDELLPLTVPKRLEFLNKKPKIKVDKTEYPNIIGYVPSYSIRNALQESNSRIPHLIVTKK